MTIEDFYLKYASISSLNCSHAQLGVMLNLVVEHEQYYHAGASSKCDDGRQGPHATQDAIGPVSSCMMPGHGRDQVCCQATAGRDPNHLCACLAWDALLESP
ncbi:hypothetical protein LIA77_10765 [Sarocladium implicatum]|nr:hypothetical protein LIA77_10765 [Sarocladium implicatum]